MFKNYLSVAWRNLKRSKIFSLINIAGLAIGISASLVIYLVVQHEFNFDKFHKDGDRIYRVVSTISFTGNTVFQNSGLPIPTAKAIQEEVTGIEKQTHFIRGNEFKISVPAPGSKSPAVFLHQPEVIYADEEYFNMFSYEWLAGSPQVALKDPFQVVLTESRAKAYFSSASPNEIIGRSIVYDDSVTVTVSGIVKDLSKPTDLDFKEFISYSTLRHSNLKDNWPMDDWGSITSSAQLLVKLKPGISAKQVETQLIALREKHRTKNDPDSPEEKDDTKHSLQPFSAIHFDTDYDAFDNRQASKPTLYGLLAVASFLLLLGCINFINLTTAQSAQRAKEIGIRKTMGSGKWQLMFQFLSETFVLTVLATVLSLVLTPWLLNIFKDFIPPGISFASLNQPHVWLFLAALIVVVSVLAGFYPALVLTKFKPVTVLKNQAYAGTAQTRKAWLRKTLTVTQFVIALFLIIATIVVSKQVYYSIHKELGYKKDAIVSFNTRWNFFSEEKDTRRFVLMEKIKAMPGIERVALGSASPASGSTSTTSMKVNNGKKIIETMVEVKMADTAYFDLYGLKLLAGKPLRQSDTTIEYVINETYSKMLGFAKPGDAIGHVVEKRFNIPITGVVADFHSKSTHTPIKPLAYSSEINRSFAIHLALKPPVKKDEWQETLAKVEKEYKKLYPEDDFNYKFYDASIAAFYKSEQDISRLLKWSAGLCIFISCLGLLGLAIYVTNARTKEIGVRKVLGASILQIVSLLSKDFLLLVLIAFVIAAPLAGWAMNDWLNDFAYRTQLSWWIFAVAGAGMLLIAMITLGIRTFRSAAENPVKSLRTE